MQIRTYQNTDEAAVIQLWQDCGLVKPQNNPQLDIQRKQEDSPELFLVGLDDEQNIIGSIMGGYDGHRGWINYLAVHPEQQRKGYARQFMQAAEALLIQQGCPKINLQVRSANTQVLAFYQAIGYMQDEVVSLGKRLIEDN